MHSNKSSFAGAGKSRDVELQCRLDNNCTHRAFVISVSIWRMVSETQDWLLFERIESLSQNKLKDRSLLLPKWGHDNNLLNDVRVAVLYSLPSKRTARTTDDTQSSFSVQVSIGVRAQYCFGFWVLAER